MEQRAGRSNFSKRLLHASRIFKSAQALSNLCSVY